MAATEQERNEFIRKCIAEGMSLSKVQDALNSELGIHMTYMELRMLTSELSVNWTAQDKKTEAAKPHSKPQDAPKQKPAEETDDDGMGDEMPPEEEGAPADEDGAADGLGGGTTKVEVSKLVPPGAALAGTVTFASGAHGEWYVDQAGRLGYDLDEGSSKPTQKDLQLFAMELRKQLQRGGAY